jgi:hypothetical protein
VILGVAGLAPMRPGADHRITLLLGQYLFPLATQFLQAGSDHRKIIGGEGSGRHVSSMFLCRHGLPPS